MANQLKWGGPVGLTVYVLPVDNATGKMARQDTQTYETINAANYSHYPIAMTDASGLGFYYADLPAWMSGSAVMLDYWIIQQAGGSPASSDATNKLGLGLLNWTGLADLISTGQNVILAATGLDSILIAGKTLPNAIKYIGAAVAGSCIGAGTGTETYNDYSGANAFIATIDTAGNRTIVYL